MSDKDLNKCCGSNCECGSEVEEKHEGCCGGHHDHEGCGCGDHDHEHFVVDLEDEEGNVISCDVIDAFEYKEEEYVLVQNPADGSVYLFKSQGEEGELTIPSEEEFEEVTKYYEEELSNQ
ncbi:MAG: DUF1292 domain-containing protein [Sarcina sp.]